MRRRRYALKAANSTFALNITSMTDMFTIMLVFLLQTYSTSDVQVIPEKGVNLPISNIESNPVKALAISVSPTELKIEGRKIASLENGKFISTDLDKNDSNFIKPLFDELSKVQKEGKTQEAKDGKLFMQADAGLAYSTLRQIMYTASMAGFPKLKMATVQGY